MQGRMERDRFSNETSKQGSGSEKRHHAPAIHVGEEFDVKIETLGHKGDGLVKIEGFTVFVKNTEAGEQVKIKIKKVKDTVAFADRIS